MAITSDRLRQTFSEGGAKEDNLRADFLDFCMEHMVAGDEFPGVQTLCMKLAYRMCKLYPELMEEFMRIIDAMEIDYYKPAVKGLRSRILNGKQTANYNH